MCTDASIGNAMSYICGTCLAMCNLGSLVASEKRPVNVVEGMLARKCCL